MRLNKFLDTSTLDVPVQRYTSFSNDTPLNPSYKPHMNTKSN